MVLPEFDLSRQPCGEGHQAGMLQLSGEDGLQLSPHESLWAADIICPEPGDQEGAPGCLGRTLPGQKGSRLRWPKCFVDVS